MQNPPDPIKFFSEVVRSPTFKLAFMPEEIAASVDALLRLMAEREELNELREANPSVEDK